MSPFAERNIFVFRHLFFGGSTVFSFKAVPGKERFKGLKMSRGAW